MEKVLIGMQMATRWTDPTFLLIMLLPYIVVFLSTTGYFGYQAYGVVESIVDKNQDSTASVVDNVVKIISAIDVEAAKAILLVFAPTALSWLVWNGVIHGFGEDKDVDTSQFVTFRDPKMAKYWRHRRIPMCELYEFYINEKCDWNPDCEDGDCYKILANHRDEFVNYKPTWRQIWWLIEQFLPKALTGAGLGKGSSSGKSIEETTKEIHEHYDKGNDVFAAQLGASMVYTCGIFHGVPEFASSGHDGDYAASAADGTLEQAQDNKMSMICDKLMLKEGEKFLDIGCGWGTLARHAASRYGAEATGVTLSKEGKIYCDLASERTGVPTNIHCCDYREIPNDEKFDKISSIEMAEHVGIANFVDPYLVNVRKLMRSKDSKFLMQVAGLRQGSNWQDVAWGLFMSKYIFPGADASTPLNWYIKQLELAGFEVHSVETIGRHYSHTLHKWYDNWMSHKEEVLRGEIDAESDHTKGTHLFRLYEFAWAYCAIASGISSATCYQILAHPNEYEYPRDDWCNGESVSGTGTTGVGLGQPRSTSIEDAFETLRGEVGHHLKKKKRGRKPAAKSAKKATSTKKKTPARKSRSKTPKSGRRSSRK